MKLLSRLSTAQIIIFISTAYLVGYFAHAWLLGKTVYGDGIYYYGWLNIQISKFSVGPAIFWAPLYIVTHNQIVVGVSDVLAVIFALILLFNLLCKQFSKTVSLMAVAAIAGASNLLFYGSLDVVNSHALTFFSATVFLSLLLARQKRWFWIGASLGFIGLIRAQDLIYGVLLIPFLTRKNLLIITMGALLAFSPQLLAWHLTTGSLLVSPYLTGNEGFNFLQPHILGVLFGASSGLFLWTPIALIGAIGLITGKRYWMLAVFLLELYIVASWSTWWQGASYSGRMFVSSLPLLTFGIASIFSWLAKYRFTQAHFLLTIVFPLTAINCISIIYFLITLK